MKPLPFAIVPISVCADARLSKIQLRVLIAILSFQNKSTGLAFPKRSDLSLRCGYSERVISRATTDLCNLGWLKKTGNGGFGRPCFYRVTTPEIMKDFFMQTVPESNTVCTGETVSDSVQITVPGSVLERCPNPTPTKNRQRTDQRTYQLARAARLQQSDRTSEGFVRRVTDRSWAEDPLFVDDEVHHADLKTTQT
jgi:hypothetical protein